MIFSVSVKNDPASAERFQSGIIISTQTEEHRNWKKFMAVDADLDGMGIKVW
jgi:hypothetical protein